MKKNKEVLSLKILKYLKSNRLVGLLPYNSKNSIKAVASARGTGMNRLNKGVLKGHFVNKKFLERRLGYKDKNRNRFCIETGRSRRVFRHFKLSRIRVRKNPNLVGVTLIVK